MKKIILLTSTIIFCSSFIERPESNVFICKGNYSKKYHYDKSCRGLSNCSTEIYKVTIEEAKRIGRDLCG